MELCRDVPSSTLVLNNPSWGKRGRAVCFSLQFIRRQHLRAKPTDFGNASRSQALSVAWIVLMIYISFKARSRDPKARIRLPLTP
jgi:hypothetical protein